jgi:hypothetical protein
LFSGGGPTADELFLLIRNKCSTKIQKVPQSEMRKKRGGVFKCYLLVVHGAIVVEKWVRKKSKSFHLITPVQALVEVREIKVE